MKAMRITFALAMGILSGIILAQSEGDFSGWMKQVAANNGKLKGNLKSKDMKGAKAAAMAIEDAFKQVETFFQSRNTADAAKMAKANHMAASEIATAVAAGNWDAAQASAATIGSSCGMCHMAHRAKGADGKFMIK